MATNFFKAGKLALKQLEPQAVHERKHTEIWRHHTTNSISGSTASICIGAAGKFRSSFEES